MREKMCASGLGADSNEGDQEVRTLKVSAFWDGLREVGDGRRPGRWGGGRHERPSAWG